MSLYGRCSSRAGGGSGRRFKKTNGRIKMKSVNSEHKSFKGQTESAKTKPISLGRTYNVSWSGDKQKTEQTKGTKTQMDGAMFCWCPGQMFVYLVKYLSVHQKQYQMA